MKNFFYGSESEMFTFFKIPKLLFSEQYEDISTDAKVLFGLMLDRMGLSAKSEKWTDPDGRVYIYFPVDETMEILNVGNQKAVKLYKELEACGLIQRERQPFGKPSKIYLVKFFKDLKNHTSRSVEITSPTCEKHTSGSVEITPLPYETDISETDKNETEISSPLTPFPGGTGEKSANASVDGASKPKRKTAKATEPLSAEEEQSLTGISPNLCDAVRGWLKYKTEKKQTYTPSGKAALLKKIRTYAEQYGTDAMIEAIDTAMTNNWQGIVWDRISNSQRAYYGGGYGNRQPPSRHVDENGHFRYNPGDTSRSL